MEGRLENKEAEHTKEDMEIFDRLFQVSSEDMEWVRNNVETQIGACKRLLALIPPNFREALYEAIQASDAALAENMSDLVAKINFYKAHCYRGLGFWDHAYKYYMESQVDAQDFYTLERLRCLSKKKMNEHKGLEVRRIKPSENLREDYEKDKDKLQRKTRQG